MSSDIVVLMYIRNEESYLTRCFDYLCTQGVKVAVLDNESTDQSADICRAFAKNLVIRRDVHPFSGYFDLTSITRGLEEMQKDIAADWFILNSPDEILQSDRPGERMSDALRRVDAQGYNVVNFDEFVFVPENESVSYLGTDYLEEMRHYYYFAPYPLRSMRAWKNRQGLSNPSGHKVHGPNIQLYPGCFVHRHYITLSWAHFRKKYERRTFAAGDLAKGWHSNRVDIDFDKSKLPSPSRLKKLPLGEPASEFDRTEPWAEHFWSFRKANRETTAREEDKENHANR